MTQMTVSTIFCRASLLTVVASYAIVDMSVSDLGYMQILAIGMSFIQMCSQNLCSPFVKLR